MRRRGFLIGALALVLPVAALSGFFVALDDGQASGAAPTLYQRVAALEKRVTALEARVTALEGGTSTTTSSSTTTTLPPSTSTTSSTTTTVPATTTTTVKPTTTTTSSTTSTYTTTSSTTSTTVPPAAFDLQKAIDACPAGGTVNVPEGVITLKIAVQLKSNIVVKGAGVDKTILYVAGERDGGAIIGTPTGVSNVTISDMTLRSDKPEYHCFGIWIANTSNVTIERVRVENCFYALKADTKHANLTVRDFTARECGQVYISRTTTGRFYNLDVECVTRRLTSSYTMHACYLEGGSSDLQFYNCRFVGGSGWTVQLYQETTGTSNVLFDGLTVQGMVPVFVGTGFSDVTIRNATVKSTTTGDPAFRISGASRVTVDTFAASGGSALVAATGTGHVFRNGTYQGPSLGGGVTFENVILVR